ncbi:MAG: hypothetical protein GNW80_01710 [Asgard group archaeon]|nr:hypothetical protein [Asgard group archaeon]
MKFIDFFKRKKKFSLEELEDIKESINDYVTEINRGSRESKRKIKNMIRKGRTPSPSLTMNYRRFKLINQQLTGFVDTIDGMIFEVEFQGVLSKIEQQSKDVFEAINSENIMATVDARLKDFVKSQIKYAEKVEQEIAKQETWLDNLQQVVEDHELESEMNLEYMTDEILVEFIIDDKEFAEELPAEVKEKPIIKQVITMLDKE